MKKKLFALLLVALLMLTLSVTAFADTNEVIFNSKQEMESNFDMAGALKGALPSGEATFSVTVRNTSGKTVEWYMLNKIIQTMEETSKGTYGGYTYRLTYQTSDGKTKELYTSDKVGGGGSDYDDSHDYTNPTEQGLKEIQDALKDYIFLERMESGKYGVLTLYVALDGETIDNSYFDALAELQLQFAVEVVPTKEVVVRTGDDPVKLSPMYIGMGVSGVVVLLLAADGAVRNALRRKEPKH